MHFAIDQEPSPAVAKVVIPEKPAEDPRAAQEAKLASEMLFASTPVRLAGETKNHTRVEVILKDIYRNDDRIYVRYAIQNNGRSTYVPGTPGVFTLRRRVVPVHFTHSLTASSSATGFVSRAKGRSRSKY
jgi:hypothetical protein